jgi:hypothetical protein
MEKNNMSEEIDEYEYFKGDYFEPQPCKNQGSKCPYCNREKCKDRAL